MKKLSLLIGITLLLNSAIVYASFTDVSNYNPYYNAIMYVQSAGVVTGYPDGTYKPDNLVNRAEFVKILVGSALNYNPSQDPSGFDIFALVGIDLTDLTSGQWYVPYIRKALQNNIIAGYPDKTFRALNNINKAEAAKIIVESFDVPLLDDSFNTNWFDKYIYALDHISAIPPSLLCFDQNVTRGELAEMIYRIKNNYTTLNYVLTYNKGATKLEYIPNEVCDAKGFMLPETAPAQNEPKIVQLDDSDVNNGSTMYDFDTEQRTNTNVNIDMMLSGMFYEDTWMRGVDWQVVPMEGVFDSITDCPASGYASAYNIGADGFGTPYSASDGDIYCLKTNDSNYVLLEVLRAYNEGDNRFLVFKYLINKTGGTKIR
jgi:hypothetical protein